MPPEQPPRSDKPVPLFVDVDGTLVRADLSLESFVRIARSGIAALIAVLSWLIAGRAVAKTLAARRDRIDPARLPYRPEVLRLIDEAKADGRPVILASASHGRHIRGIADHLGLADPVIATRGRSNLKGPAKLAAIRARIGADAPFDYVGDSRADTCLWRDRAGRSAMFRQGRRSRGSATRAAAPCAPSSRRCGRTNGPRTRWWSFPR